MQGEFVLENQFPSQTEAIADLRKVDPIFDEICRDFILLAEDYQKIESGQERVSENVRSDFRESLGGLRKEIAQTLDGTSKQKSTRGKD